MKVNHRLSAISKRQRRVRMKVRGTSERPRLNVFRSNKHISLQVIDDAQGKTVASMSTLTTKVSGTKTNKAIEMGKMLAQKLKDAKIKKLVFDRGSYRYHGRVRAVADAMREAGIQV